MEQDNEEAEEEDDDNDEEELASSTEVEVLVRREGEESFSMVRYVCEVGAQKWKAACVCGRVGVVKTAADHIAVT